ncbi:MAG: winged helix-turn-helix transcriptional regulator [Caldilineaceae bacterium]|nr:winged helix-turn-helix transcriptional regulator [Caldilineaceae bacterium]
MRETSPYRAIADLNRRKILDLLRTAGPLQAGDIVAHLPAISQPAVSKHLRILRETGLVQTMAQGRERIYTLNPTALQQVAEWLQAYEALWDIRLATLKAVAERADAQEEVAERADAQEEVAERADAQEGSEA